MFSPRFGEKSRKEDKAKGGGHVETLNGKFENKTINPACDFHFAQQPLLKNHDIIDISTETVDWNFEEKSCFGFVKCVFKVTDGWEAERDLEEAEETPKEGQGEGDKAALEDASGGGFFQSFLAKTGVGGKKEEKAAAHKGHGPGSSDQEEEIDFEEALMQAENVEFPHSPDEPLPIFPDDILRRIKSDDLRKHALELQSHIVKKYKTNPYGPPPKDPAQLRAYIDKIQQRSLRPLIKSAIQKELEHHRNHIGALTETILLTKTSIKNNNQKTFDELAVALDDLSEKLKKQDNEKDCVTYEDFMKARIREVLRTCRDDPKIAHDAPVQLKAKNALLRIRDIEMLATSYNADPELRRIFEWTADDKEFFKHFRDETPTKIRCRLYFMKANIIFGKAYGSADPYLKFTIGQETNSLRNQPCLETNEPEFYIVQEIDLADRWHSQFLKNKTNKQEIPRESRPLVVQQSGKQSVTGSLLMWVEMIDSKEAADKKASPLQKPAPTEVELRFVIRTTHNVKLIDNGKCDVRVSTSLQCDEYFGQYPRQQKTDVHFGSLGEAVFNWRMVYPKITIPTKSCVVSLELYDYNLIAGDTQIGAFSLDVRKYVEKVGQSMDTIEKTSQLQVKSQLDEDEGQNIGEIKFEMYVLPQSEATSKLAGIARDDPNEHPQLMTPMEGRGWDSVLPSLAFSLPSFGFYKKVIPLIVFTLLCLVGMKYVGLL